MLRIAVLSLCLPAIAAAQSALRPLRFELNQKVVFDVTTSTELNLGPAGARTELTLRTTVEAIEVDGQQTRLRITWDEVYGEVGIRFMTARFDSREDVESDYAIGKARADRLGKSIVDDIKAPHLALRGFSYDVVVDSRGAIVELPDLGEKLDALRAELAKQPNRKMVRAFHSEDVLRWHVRMLVPSQPVESAKVGDVWRRAAVFGLGNSGMGRVETDIDYKLESLEDGKAEISWTGKPDIGNPKIRVKDSALDGSQVLSLDDGLPLTVDVEFRLDVEIDTKFGNAIPQTLGCEYEVVRVRTRPK